MLTAAPGAGKTTRVPPALIDRGRVLLLQPRRVAARAMAKRIAEERGWTVGAEIGWHIRFDRQFAKDTRLLVVTEGILTAYLQDDPLLSDVATLVVDEFHERSVHADLGLALARQAWLARPDLRILVMSATLDTAPVSAFLGGCPVIDVPGTLHPMTVDYAPGESVADALRQVLPATRGNVLCFLPGAREIAQTIAAADSRGASQRCGPDSAARFARRSGAGCRAITDRACLAEPREGHRRDQRRGNVTDRSGRVGGDRHRPAQGRPLRCRSRRRFADHRAHHAG